LQHTSRVFLGHDVDLVACPYSFSLVEERQAVLSKGAVEHQVPQQLSFVGIWSFSLPSLVLTALVQVVPLHPDTSLTASPPQICDGIGKRCSSDASSKVLSIQLTFDHRPAGMTSKTRPRGLVVGSNLRHQNPETGSEVLDIDTFDRSKAAHHLALRIARSLFESDPHSADSVRVAWKASQPNQALSQKSMVTVKAKLEAR
jgi:hypothetical protein